MKKLLALILTLLILCSFAACSRKPLEFNAAYTYSDPDNRFEEPVLFFKKDGNFSFSDSNDGLRIRGTYVYDKEADQLKLTSTNGRYTLVLNVESKEVLRLVSFADAQGQQTLTLPDNAPFNIGDETMLPKEDAAPTQAAEPTRAAEPAATDPT